MKKRAFILLVAGTCFCLCSTPALAENANQTVNPYERIASTATVGGSEYELLDVFNDAEGAYESFSAEHSDFLTECQNDGLPPLSASTAALYKEAAIDSGLSYQEESEILSFLDIFENPFENEMMRRDLERIEAAKLNGDCSEAEADYSMSLLLPTQTPNLVANEIQPFNSGINLSLARSYADQFATTYNATYGYIGGADCTNFVSQILHHAGVSMDYKNSTSSGWWWLGKTNRSTSWINANTFKNYMGSGYTTRTWSSFVSNVRSGDIIGLDYGADGVVDHCGFVYTTDGSRLRIAQHSADYLDWNRGWPNYNNSGRYYRIRR